MIYAVIMIAGIILLLTVPFIGAGRKGRGRRITSQNYRKVQIDEQLGLTTLATKLALVAVIVAGATDKIRISSVKLNCVWDDMTGTGGTANEDGPLLIGVAHGDYTVTEVKEFIEASSSVDFDDKIAAERSRRLIRVIGTLSAMQISDPANGGLRKIKLNWVLGEASTLNIFAFNTGGSALTTGSQLSVSGHANVWRI